jgi:hypothetical protein
MTKSLATKFDLTEMQAGFVRLVSEGIDPNRAVEVVGYSTSNTSAQASELLRIPAVLAAIHNEVRRLLVADAPVARAVIMRMVKDEKTPPKIRLDGAKTLLDRAGHIAPRAVFDKGNYELSLHELSIESCASSRKGSRANSPRVRKTLAAADTRRPTRNPMRRRRTPWRDRDA